MAVKIINDEMKQKIYDAFQNEDVTKASLAREYDCSPRTIGRIIKAMETTGTKLSTLKTEKVVKPEPVMEEVVPVVYNYSITPSIITLFVDEDTIVIDDSDGNFNIVKQLLIKETPEAYEEAHDLMDVKKMFIGTCSDRVYIENNQLLIDGKLVSGDLVNVIVEKLKDELHADADKYVKFLEKCYDNPSVPDIDTIYRFIKCNSIKIDDDGDVIAYRVVTNDYLDKYTKTIDNSIGAKPKMNREDVDHDNNRTCSSGLHACSFSYVGVYSGADDRVVKIKISPYNICSVPTDYNDAKARICEYEVIGDVY